MFYSKVVPLMSTQVLAYTLVIQTKITLLVDESYWRQNVLKLKLWLGVLLIDKPKPERLLMVR